MAEVWLSVPSEPGVLVSDDGRVLLQPSYAPLPNGGYRAYFPEPTYGVTARAKKGAAHEYRLIKAWCSSDKRKATLPRGEQHYTRRRAA